MRPIEFSYDIIPASARPIRINASKCIGCNRCVQICQVDILVPGEEAGKPPVVAWPGECWYCGCCVMECPKEAITLRHPLMNEAAFISIDNI